MATKARSARVWDGEEISFMVAATGRGFSVRRKFDRYRCVRGFAAFEGGRRVSGYRILTRDTLENWLDSDELIELESTKIP
jgi:hypothetical protein